jgi:LPS export ABC transporter protein LptC
VKRVAAGALLGLALVACEDASTTAGVTTEMAADSADQVMFGVRFLVTDGGVRRTEVEADTAFTYEENTRTEMRNVRAKFFKPTGEENAVLTSRQGTYNSRLGSMEARGDAILTATDGRKLTSPHLRYDPSRNEISSDSAFVLTETSGRVSEGTGFVADPDLNSIRVLARARSRGIPVTIPPR